MEVKRGQIWFVKNDKNAVYSEIKGTRPAIIVSNDVQNMMSDVIEVVYLTASDKKALPTHVSIKSIEKSSIALCEQVCAIDKRRLFNKIGKITKLEEMQVNIALIMSFGLESVVA